MFYSQLLLSGKTFAREKIRADTSHEVSTLLVIFAKVLPDSNNYKKYSQFLTQKQIERVYELESKVMRRMARRSANINTRVKRQRSTPLNR